jgi:hypothetical protein
MRDANAGAPVAGEIKVEEQIQGLGTARDPNLRKVSVVSNSRLFQVSKESEKWKSGSQEARKPESQKAWIRTESQPLEG